MSDAWEIAAQLYAAGSCLPPGTVVTISSEKVDKYGGRYDATVTYLGADGKPHDLVGDLIAGQWGAPYGGSGPMPVPPWPRTVA